ncbi:hypothetical protein QIU18_13405 [Capnocytophaga canimorsus]|nr:hypothetical protein [Capnocytophaga canimorsus]WGU68488.1 hypothetical protein QIU19_00140 [Capnocytophaga canimorsus]WGU70404.1 hypothetical protein QIU18_13405 [Capnocytophaga canimorsus]
MKYIIGIIVVLIVLSVGAYFLADLWGYDTLITPEELKKRSYYRDDCRRGIGFTIDFGAVFLQRSRERLQQKPQWNRTTEK